VSYVNNLWQSPIHLLTSRSLIGCQFLRRPRQAWAWPASVASAGHGRLARSPIDRGRNAG